MRAPFLRRYGLISPLCLLLIAPPGIASQELPGIAFLEVGKIEIEGNQAFTDSQLLKLIKLRPGGNFSSFTWQESLEDLFLFYRTQGFLGVEITRADRQFDPERNILDLTIHLNEGPQTFLAGLEVQGVTVFGLERLMALAPVRAGEPVNEAKIRDWKDAIEELYLPRGYRYVTVRDSLVTSVSQDSVRAVLIVREGSLVRVGEIRVAGNKHVKADFIRNGMTLEPGDILNPEEVQESQRFLYTTGLFQDVRIEEEGTELQAPEVDLVVHVREGEPRWINFRVGYGSTEGIRGLLEWGTQNLLRRGEMLQARLQGTFQPFEELAATRSTYLAAVAFTQPFFLGTKVRAGLSVSLEGFDFRSFDQTELATRLSFTRQFGLRRSLTGEIALKGTEISNVERSLEVPDDVLANIGSRTTNSITISYLLDRREDIFYPRGRDNLIARASLAGGPLFGSVNFYRMVSDYARYMSTGILPRGVLAVRGRVGFVEGFSGTESVPPSEQFTLGGANSLRGFSEASISPPGLPQKPPAFGGGLTQFNMEERFRIWKNFDGVIFYDLGSMFEGLEEIDLEFKQGFGLGLRYRTPIGPFRLEFGTNPDRFARERFVDRWIVHIGVGQPF